MTATTRSVPTSPRTVTDRCDDHLTTLHLTAELRLGARSEAHRAVIEALVAATGLPIVSTPVAGAVWEMLATHFHPGQADAG